ncbi:hypothetical protein BLNAU_2499 [Blattamonas nauphoetae]|uniref:Uncharacterized protein n=1 Tax=Blattamonas nauphoetae TaxID=2049346 RepID=A0ABQ9YFW2_9EUKA|nr:hypothetical protein BLNAU_2499 [Blattamonas nauphoetae]
MSLPSESLGSDFPSPNISVNSHLSSNSATSNSPELSLSTNVITPPLQPSQAPNFGTLSAPNNTEKQLPEQRKPTLHLTLLSISNCKTPVTLIPTSELCRIDPAKKFILPPPPIIDAPMMDPLKPLICAIARTMFPFLFDSPDKTSSTVITSLPRSAIHSQTLQKWYKFKTIPCSQHTHTSWHLRQTCWFVHTHRDPSLFDLVLPTTDHCALNGYAAADDSSNANWPETRPTPRAPTQRLALFRFL